MLRWTSTNPMKLLCVNYPCHSDGVVSVLSCRIKAVCSGVLPAFVYHVTFRKSTFLRLNSFMKRLPISRLSLVEAATSRFRQLIVFLSDRIFPPYRKTYLLK